MPVIYPTSLVKADKLVGNPDTSLAVCVCADGVKVVGLPEMPVQATLSAEDAELTFTALMVASL